MEKADPLKWAKSYCISGGDIHTVHYGLIDPMEKEDHTGFNVRIEEGLFQRDKNFVSCLFVKTSQ